MLFQAAEELDVDLTQSYMIGDAVTDLIAGKKAGCRTYLVLTGRGFQQLLPALHTLGGDFTISRNLMRATTQILKSELNISDDNEPSTLTYTQLYRQMFSVAGGI
jgi:histidinol phosphatase-like enzyme